jgi:hypothetical protein
MGHHIIQGFSSTASDVASLVLLAPPPTGPSWAVRWQHWLSTIHPSTPRVILERIIRPAADPRLHLSCSMLCCEERHAWEPGIVTHNHLPMVHGAYVRHVQKKDVRSHHANGFEPKQLRFV